MTCRLRLTRRPALFPPRGEEKEKREAVERAAHWSNQSSTGFKRSGNENDFADVLAIGDELVGVAGAVEREGLGDDGLDLPRFDLGLKRLDDPRESRLVVGPGEH